MPDPTAGSDVQFLIFGAFVWVFTFFGFALHVADVQRRSKQGKKLLSEYDKPRPIEWLLAGMLLLACGAAILGALQIQGLIEADASAVARFEVAAGAALGAVALAYLALRGKTWLTWARDEFINTAGATTVEAGEVLVDVALEAQYDTVVAKRTAWPIYFIGCTPLVLAALRASVRLPLPAMIALLGAAAGAALMFVVLSSFPITEEDEDW